MTKRSKIKLPTTPGGQVIPLNLPERTVYGAIKKAGSLRESKAQELLGHNFALTTRLSLIRKLQGYGLINIEREPGGERVYKLKSHPDPKPEPRIGELRCYQCVRHPRLSIRNDAKFIDGLFETTNLVVQELIESSGDFGVLIVRISPEEAQTARIDARAERDRVEQSCVVRS